MRTRTKDLSTRETNRHRSRGGFTLVEALLAIAITGIAGAALMLGVNSSVRLAHAGAQRTIALGMARQMMDEIAGCAYMEPGSDDHQQWPLGPGGSETAHGDRELYDDIDDYAGYSDAPPESPRGVALGTDDGEGDERDPYFFAPSGFFDNWRRTVEVYYVDDDDPSQRLPNGSTSNRRAIEVVILYDDPDGSTRELARLRRVVSYVPVFDSD